MRLDAEEGDYSSIGVDDGGGGVGGGGGGALGAAECVCVIDVDGDLNTHRQPWYASRVNQLAPGQHRHSTLPGDITYYQERI